MRKLWFKLTTTRFSKDHNDRQEYMTRATLAVMAIALFINTPIMFIVGILKIFPFYGFYMSIILWLTFFAILLIKNKKIWNLAKFLPTYSFLVAAIYTIYKEGFSLADNLQISLGMLFATVLLSAKSQITYLIISTSSMIIMLIYSNQPHEDDAANILRTFMYLIFVIAIIRFLSRQYKKALSLANKEIASRKKTEKQLESKVLELEKTNEHLVARELRMIELKKAGK